MMASIFCSPISRFAFSMRPRRSSAVIGFALSRTDVSAAMLGGSGPEVLPPARRCADTGETERPAAALVSQRNDRRVSMEAFYASIIQLPALAGATDRQVPARSAYEGSATC